MLGPPGIHRDMKWLSGACKLFSTDDKLFVLCGQLTADSTIVAPGLKYSSAWLNFAELSVNDCGDFMKVSFILDSPTKPATNHAS